MSEANNATCPGTDAYAIGSTLNATKVAIDGVPNPPTDCVPYSGENSKSIAATTIEKTVTTFDDITNVTESETYTGVAITYSGGTC